MDLNFPVPVAEARATGEAVPPHVFRLKRPGKQRSLLEGYQDVG